ncbi:hypothetical protein FPSE_01738 [Fusarium pseudograminearum CS3096]|uniref:RING-type domain-containing protein n=1 Tax=Fusarium pseudograminearum (strain CS3096) TaxID=1028729 RepID=K3VRS4_FUSPC|nr:hypothetical protein FPSE_01738 [Fusarium pseudograminearum CS3096]EKJ78277.1 hypothetical protein FPSE_01738 [Fusarium pseudograminearum CS3096]
MSSTNIPLATFADDTTFPPITDTFWPDFKEEVENDEQNLRVHALRCGLCDELMPSQLAQAHDQHRPWIFPCGHMVGSSCLMLTQGNNFLDKNLNLACPVCRVDLPLHGCGHPAIGMQAPLDKKSFSHVSPVLSNGGLSAIKCGLCEARSALKYLRAVAELDPPRMKRGKRMNLSIRTNPMRYDIVYQDDHHKVVERKDNEALHQRAMEYKDVPKTVRDLWEQYVKDWSEQAHQLWFYPNPSSFSLHASVGKKKKEEMGFWEKLLVGWF